MKAAILLMGLLFAPPTGTFSVKGELQPGNEYITSDTTRPNVLRIRPFNLDIVPPSSGVQFYRNGIIFLSRSMAGEKIPERHFSFGSVRTYTSTISDTVTGPCEALNLEGSTLFPSEATTFTPDYNTMYLSLIPEESSTEKIFMANYSASGWKIEREPLEICTGNYIYSHPCLSSDGTFMIFSSNMPGSAGGLDLYVILKEENGWSKPENLGKYINSSGNELFASLDSRNNLYFSSDGLPGKGGYDVFICRYNGSGWDKPLDLPGSVNTKDDELSFTINRADDKTAFYTSRVRSGRYRTQLFILDINPALADKSNISMGDRFLENTGKPEQAFQPDGKVSVKQFANSTANPEIMNQDTGMNPDGMKTKPASQDTVTGKQAVTQANVDKSVTQPELKEVQPVEEQVLAAQKGPTTEGEVVYRVQIIANTKSVGSQSITVAGKSYKSFEYLYMGGYRTTIGEFRTLAEASRLQVLCRQNGYSQAFVVAFKNNVRSNDPALFK